MYVYTNLRIFLNYTCSKPTCGVYVWHMFQHIVICVYRNMYQLSFASCMIFIYWICILYIYIYTHVSILSPAPIYLYEIESIVCMSTNRQQQCLYKWQLWTTRMKYMHYQISYANQTFCYFCICKQGMNPPILHLLNTQNDASKPFDRFEYKPTKEELGAE